MTSETLVGKSWTDHPLQKPVGGGYDTQLNVEVLAYDNIQKQYVSAYDNTLKKPISCYIKEVKPSATYAVANFDLDSSGKATVNVPLVPYVAYELVVESHGQVFGDEYFTFDESFPLTSFYRGPGNVIEMPLRIKKWIYPDYYEFVVGPAWKSRKLSDVQSNWYQDLGEGWHALEVMEFERSHSQANFNVLFEGDSWFYYFPDDIYDHLVPLLEQEALDDVSALPLQVYGAYASTMFSNAGSKNEKSFLLKYCKQHSIDVIFLSFGGNDAAFSGAYNLNSRWKYAENKLMAAVSADWFMDPYRSGFTVDAKLKSNMTSSFSALLKNHPWHAYLLGAAAPKFDTGADVLDQVQTIIDKHGLSMDLSLTSSMEVAGAHAILQPATTTFPNVVLNPYDEILDIVFDRSALAQRLNDIHQLAYNFLAEYGTVAGALVLGHSYCYPIFSDEPIRALGTAILEGPWFHQRMKEANVDNLVLQAFCLKSMIDMYVAQVLEPLKADFPYFDYVDLRSINNSSADWHDEMHLTSQGFEKAAAEMLKRVKSTYPARFKP